MFTKTSINILHDPADSTLGSSNKNVYTCALGDKNKNVYSPTTCMGSKLKAI